MANVPQLPFLISRFSQYSDYTIKQVNYLYKSDMDFPESKKRIMTYQYECLNEIKSFFQDYSNLKPGYVVLPTETDKSFITSLVPYYLGIGKTAIIVPSVHVGKQLMQNMTGDKNNQTIYVQRDIIKPFNADGYRPVVNLYSNDSPQQNDNCDIIVIHMNDIIKKDDTVDTTHLKNVDLVIVYEMDDHPEISWSQIVESCPNLKCLLLHATN